MGSPHERIPVAIVAGTNGKGSVSKMIQTAATACGSKTGLYTSPHLFDIRERISINGRDIGRREFAGLDAEVRKAERGSGCGLSEFERNTALAIVYFDEEKCDLCVMEAGLGGRLDASNVCENRKVSVITKIAVDHTEYLGSTLEEIAREKTGIIRAGVPVIDASRTGLVRTEASRLRSRVFSQGKEYRAENMRPLSDGYYSFDYFSGKTVMEKITCGMRGIHQCDNAACAVTASVILGCGDEKVLRLSVAEAVMPGRLQMLRTSSGKKVFADVAHNPDSMKILSDFVKCWRPAASRLFAIFGVYKDKDYGQMAGMIREDAYKVYTVTPDNARALDGNTLAGLIGPKAVAMKNIDDAYRSALSEMMNGDWLLACGSFSIAGPVIRLASRR